MEAWVTTKMIVAGDDVAAFGTSRARIKSNGIVYEGQWAHAMTVVNDRITHYRQYDDTAGIAEAFAKK